MHTISIQGLCNIKDDKTAIMVKIILWALLALAIISTSVIALSDIMTNCLTYVVSKWNLDENMCNGNEPMLLSRAITTDAYTRGIAISMSLFGALLIDTPALKNDHHSRIHDILKYAFLCFALAFTVSMFDAASTHTILIVSGSIAFLIATQPQTVPQANITVCKPCFTVQLWQFLWTSTIISMIVWVIGYYISVDVIRSYWYIAEYVFFAFLLDTVAFVNIYLELIYSKHFGYSENFEEDKYVQAVYNGEEEEMTFRF